MCATKFECEGSSACIQVVQSEAITATTITTSSQATTRLSTKTSFSSHNASKAEAPPKPINLQDSSELYSGHVAVEASKAEPTPDASREATTPGSISPSFQESPSATSPQEAPPSSITPTLGQKEADESDKGFDNEIDDGDLDGDEPNRGYRADNVVMKFGPLTDGVVRLFMFHGYYAGELRIPGPKMSLEGSQCAANDIANVDRLFNL